MMSSMIKGVHHKVISYKVSYLEVSDVRESKKKNGLTFLNVECFRSKNI